MANYYHEARAHAKNIRHMQDDNRRRAERRAEKAGVEVCCTAALLLRALLARQVQTAKCVLGRTPYQFVENRRSCNLGQGERRAVSGSREHGGHDSHEWPA